MASISSDKAGRHRIQFYDGSGERKGFRVGRMPVKKVEEIAGHVEKLNFANISGGTPPVDTAKWVAEQDPKLRKKLAAEGLITIQSELAANPTEHDTAWGMFLAQLKPEQLAKIKERFTVGPEPTLGAFLESYIIKRESGGSAMRSAINYRQAAVTLCAYFGEGKLLSSITEADAEDWRRWMATNKAARKNRKEAEGLAPNTYKRRCGFARQFFATANKARLIESNPFLVLKGIAVKAVKSRSYFLSREHADKIIEACPDTEWRLLFALARYGGLRCPSETHALTWGDVDWLGDRLTVHVPKLAHLGEEFATRIIPLFPELRAELQDAWSLAAHAVQGPVAGDAPVIAKHRGANLRTRLTWIVKRAGLKPWPKLFQNLRSTRQTELAERYPAHVVCAWLGNSEAIARDFYLQVTPEHYATAAERDDADDSDHPPTDGGAKVVRKVVRHGAISHHTEPHGDCDSSENPEKTLVSAVSGSEKYTPQESNL